MKSIWHNLCNYFLTKIMIVIKKMTMKMRTFAGNNLISNTSIFVYELLFQVAIFTTIWNCTEDRDLNCSDVLWLLEWKEQRPQKIKFHNMWERLSSHIKNNLPWWEPLRNEADMEHSANIYRTNDVVYANNFRKSTALKSRNTALSPT